MFCIRAGTVSKPINIGEICAEIHKERKEAIDREIARRNKDNIPLDDLVPLDDYNGDKELDGLFLQVKMLSKSDTDIALAKWGDALETIGSTDGYSEDAKYKEAMNTIGVYNIVNEFIVKGLHSLTGIRDNVGEVKIEAPVQQDILDLLQSLNLTITIFNLIVYLQDLDNAKKKY